MTAMIVGVTFSLSHEQREPRPTRAPPCAKGAAGSSGGSRRAAGTTSRPPSAMDAPIAALTGRVAELGEAGMHLHYGDAVPSLAFELSGRMRVQE